MTYYLDPKNDQSIEYRAPLKRLPFAVSPSASSREPCRTASFRADTGLRQAQTERVCRYFSRGHACLSRCKRSGLAQRQAGGHRRPDVYPLGYLQDIIDLATF